MELKYIYLILTTFLCIISIIYNIKLNRNTKNKELKKTSIRLKKLDDFINKNYKLILFLIFVILFFTSFYQLGIVPGGIHIDEAGMAYDSYTIANFGVDRYLNYFPVYLINYGGGQSVMYAYLAAILIKICGYSLFIVRLPAVIFRIITAVSVYSMFKECDTKLSAILGMFLVSVCPYFIMQSRWGLDCNLLLGFLSMSFCLFIKSVKGQKNNLFLVSGIFFGLSLYNYALSYIMIPIILVFLLLYLLYLKKIQIKQLFIFGIPLILFALPLMLMILVNNNFLDEIHAFITIPKLPGYRGSELSFSNIGKNMYIFKSLLTHDNTSIFNTSLFFNSLPQYGTLYYISIPFVIIGIIISIKRVYISIKVKKIDYNTFLFIWFLGIILCLLIIKDPNINKANAIFVPIVYFIVLGIQFITSKNKINVIIIIVLYLINMFDFSIYYFNKYNNYYKNQVYVVNDFISALEFAKSRNDEKIFIEENCETEEYIFPLLINHANPYDYNRTNIENKYYEIKNKKYYLKVDNIESDGIYIIRKSEDLKAELKEKEYKMKIIGIYSVFYKSS